LVITGVSTEWQQQKQAYKERLSTIVIPLDISAGVAKGLLARIDAFFSELRLEVAEVSAQKEQVEILIREIERVKAIGGNEIARKKAASEAVQKYEVNGTIINLYDVQRELVEKDSFLYGVLDVLNGKQARLITISGVLKLEKDLSPYGTL
jgi:ribosome maturation protein Sdo1